MRRRIFVVIAVAFLDAAQGQQPEPRQATINAHKIADSLYFLEAGLDGYYGSNIAASIGDDGIILVDAQTASAADKLLAKLNTLSDKPIRFVINTHCHGDHTGGNTVLQSNGATIVAHRNVRERLSSPYCGKDIAAPTITFDQELILHLNGEGIRLIRLPSGHTDGDVMVYFPKANVAHVGDVLMSLGLPGSDRMVGGNMVGLIAALEQVIRLLPDNVRIIPGHGPLISLDDVRKAATRLKEMQAVVAEGIEHGKTFEQLKAARVLDEWRQFVHKDTPMDYYIFNFYRDLTAQRSAR
jgi:cyclase